MRESSNAVQVTEQRLGNEALVGRGGGERLGRGDNRTARPDSIAPHVGRIAEVWGSAFHVHLLEHLR
jgi:hypothetical protein